jgi:hypothetical protein
VPLGLGRAFSHSEPVPGLAAALLCTLAVCFPLRAIRPRPVSALPLRCLRNERTAASSCAPPDYETQHCGPTRSQMLQCRSPDAGSVRRASIHMTAGAFECSQGTAHTHGAVRYIQHCSHGTTAIGGCTYKVVKRMRRDWARGQSAAGCGWGVRLLHPVPYCAACWCCMYTTVHT